MTARWIDISVPIYSGMVHWPDNPAVRIERIQDLSRGDAANVSKLEMGAHTGTHMDAPRHFLADGAGLDELPLDATIGPARVVPIAHPQAILPEELEAHRLRAGERVLFRTQNSERCWKDNRFVEDFVYISAAAAQYLVQRKVRTVGIDYLSVGGYVHDGVETHRILLGAGIWLIEGLNLTAVKPGAYELVCLPLRIVGADGAPARAILRPRGRRENKPGKLRGKESTHGKGRK
ncbi:MAG TPA: cyclase family protein [Geobacteraceae bacterium]|nr:cyclase family protein [Geobacteraceae bacterium]